MNWCKECDFAQWEINPRTLVPELWCAAQVAQISPNNDACEDFVSANERKQVITHSPKTQCMQSQHCTFCNGATALEMKLDNGTTVAVTYQVPIKSLVIRHITADTVTSLARDIRYCPICGRDLHKDVKIP